jgi:hypothetical protein
VKKQSIILVFVMLLMSCNSLTSNTIANSTETPSSGIETTWKTYTNAEVGFTIQYPSDWQEQDLPDENDGQLHHVALTGPEGGVELIWGVGLGGACPQGYEPIAVAQGTWPACHSQRDDGTELWSLAPPPIGDTNFAGFVYTNNTTAESREVVLQVISTLSFP